MAQELNKINAREFKHVFGGAAVLWSVLQLIWMLQRQNYADFALRLLSAPAAAVVFCMLYGIILKTASRAFSVSHVDFFSKIKSIFPLFYGNAFLVFFPYSFENALFVELVFFIFLHLYLLAALTPVSAMEKTCTLFLFLILTFCMSEGLLRTGSRFYPSFLFTPNSYNRFKGKPHSYHFDFKLNSGGYNDKEFTLKKKQHTFRVAGLGDSFLFGLVPYRHNFLTLLEKRFIKEKRNVEIYNMGIYGTALDDYYNLLVHEVLALKPDIVLCHLNVGNDIENYYASASFHTDNLFHYKEWFVYKLADYAFRIKPKFKGRIIRGRAIYDDTAPPMRREDFMAVKLERVQVFDRASDIRLWYQSAKEILLKMKAQTEKIHADFIVVLIPDELQYNPGLQKEFKAAASAMHDEGVMKHAPDFDFNLPQASLIPFLREQNIAAVDMLPVFKKSAGRERLNIPNDNHWNIAGNKLAADVLYGELRKKLVSGR